MFIKLLVPEARSKTARAGKNRSPSFSIRTYTKAGTTVRLCRYFFSAGGKKYERTREAFNKKRLKAEPPAQIVIYNLLA